MALIQCPECQTEVSSEALTCPKCGKQLRKSKRSVGGQIAKWLFIIFNILMLWWFIKSGASTGDEIVKAASEAERTGVSIGGGISMMFILFIWGIGDIILGLFTILTRPKK